MLLQRIHPGTMLKELDDRLEPVRIAAGVLRELHRTPPPSNHSLPHFSDWMQGAHRDALSCKDKHRAQPYLDQFPRVFGVLDELTVPGEPQLLLHGDFHHWNILLDEEDGWMAIDPKGVIGASCLDFGRFIGNHCTASSRSEVRELHMETIEILSEESGESRERVFAGALCDFVMGHSWGFEKRTG